MTIGSLMTIKNSLVLHGAAEQVKHHKFSPNLIDWFIFFLDPETAGIMAWNKIFVIPNGEGEKVGVLLLDTQGAFDDDSDVKDVTLIFSLSTMISR